MAGGPNRTKNGTIPATKGSRLATPIEGAKAAAARVNFEGANPADLRALQAGKVASVAQRETPPTFSTGNSKRLKAVIPELREARQEAAEARAADGLLRKKAMEVRQKHTAAGAFAATAMKKPPPEWDAKQQPHIKRKTAKVRLDIYREDLRRQLDSAERDVTANADAARGHLGAAAAREARAQRMFDALTKQRGRMRRNKGRQGDLFATAAAPAPAAKAPTPAAAARKPARDMTALRAQRDANRARLAARVGRRAEANAPKATQRTELVKSGPATGKIWRDDWANDRKVAHAPTFGERGKTSVKLTPTRSELIDTGLWHQGAAMHRSIGAKDYTVTSKAFGSAGHAAAKGLSKSQAERFIRGTGTARTLNRVDLARGGPASDRARRAIDRYVAQIKGKNKATTVAPKAELTKHVLVDGKGSVIGGFATKKAAHAEGMKRRRAGEAVFAHPIDFYQKHIRRPVAA